MKSFATQDYWDSSYEGLDLNYNSNYILFKDLFTKYLKGNGTCLEIGCYPGNFSVYLGKELNYEISGIDTTPFVLTRLPLHFKQNNVRIGKLYNENFLTFNPEYQYDLVCSFGFIEHFVDFEAVIEKHIQLVKPSGTLIISCPNFRKLQYILHRYLDNENLKHHNLESMNLEKWTHLMQKHKMEILYSGYYQTADFWTNSPKNGPLKRIISTEIQTLLRYVDKYLHYPNSFTSPHIVCIARKMK
jgi:2-polyprenyl-3-methyl-5-hydroxy-6-metoxy-1,4-benzoquinol methylase